MFSLGRLRDQLLVAVGLIALLYLGRGVLIPLAYSLLMAMVLYPMVAGMERRGVPRLLSIFLALLVVTVLVCGIGGLLIWELMIFREDLPSLSGGAVEAFHELRAWVSSSLMLAPGRQDAWIADLQQRIPASFWSLAVRAADLVFGMFFNLFIIPVLTGLLLHGHRRLVEGVTALASPDLRPLMPGILHRSVHRFAAFIFGMVKVYAIVGVLNSIGLLLLGVPNAVLFGMLTALMTIVPYVGIVLSSLLPMSVAWLATGSIWSPLGVVAVLAVVQYLEANIIFPKVVGLQLGLNTLASIVIVLAGALIWGVSGMVLLLPFISILLIISDDVPAWRPLKLLLGIDRSKKRAPGATPD